MRVVDGLAALGLKDRPFAPLCGGDRLGTDSASTMESGDEEQRGLPGAVSAGGHFSFALACGDVAFADSPCGSLAGGSAGGHDAGAASGSAAGSSETAASEAGPDVADDELRGLGEMPAKRAGPVPTWSAGSMAHGTGECRPCAFYWKPRGCKDGQACTHCHLCPQGAVKARRAAQSQAQSLERRRLQRLRREASVAEGERPQVAWPPSAQEELPLSLQEPRKVIVSSLLAPPDPTSGLPPHLTAAGALLPREGWPTEASTLRLPGLFLDDVASESSSSGEEELDDEPDYAQLSSRIPLSSRWSISIGSRMHGTGECKPCAWFWKPQGCQNGKDCRHCHLCPLGEIRERKRKSRARRATGTTPTGAPPQALGAPPPLPSEPLQPAQGWAEITASAPGSAAHPAPADGFEVLACGAAASPQAAAGQPLSPVLPGEGPPSVGSAWHGTGLCRPCAWFWKPQGCGNGASCQHCHICPDGEIKARKKVKMACLRFEESRVRRCEEESWKALLGPDFGGLHPAGAVSPQPVAGLPSMGSALHASGKCKPCAWFWKAQGCHNGQACAHCHLCPQGELQARMKAKRVAMRSGVLAPVASPGGQRQRLVVKIAPVLGA